MILTGIGIVDSKAGGPVISCVVECFTSNATWSCCPGTTCIEVVAVGGGAGGRSGICFGGNPSRVTGGPGGGAGGVSICTLTSGFGTSQCVIIGTGGASDTAGGASCFGSLVTANGGAIGAAAVGCCAVGTSTAAGGAGGSGNEGTSPAGGNGNSEAFAFGDPGNQYWPQLAGGPGNSATGKPGAGGGGGGRAACLYAGYGYGGAAGSGSTLCGIPLGAGGTGADSVNNSNAKIGASASGFGGGGGGGASEAFPLTPSRAGGTGGSGIIKVTQYILS